MCRLVRSHLPPHQAVFRVPKQLTKLDIKAYLENLYKINITDVRTMVYLGKKFKVPVPGKFIEKKKPSYKKAIVTMTEDFIFPPPPQVPEALKMPSQNDRPVGKGSHSAFKKSNKKA